MTTHRQARPDPLWDTDDVAVFLKVSAKTVREWRHKGTGPNYLRYGKHVRYRHSDVTAWLETTLVVADDWAA